MAENPSKACEEKGLAAEPIALEAANVPAPEAAAATATGTPAVANETGFSPQKINAADDPPKATCDCTTTTSTGTAESFCEAEQSDISFICPGTNSDGDNMPQWKRDLIQRRKINIARTIGANHSTYCQKKASDPMLISSTSPVMMLLSKTQTDNSNGSSSSTLGSKNTKSSSHNHSSNVKSSGLSHQSHQQQQQQGLSSGHYTSLNSSFPSQQPQRQSTSQDIQSVHNAKLTKGSVGSISNNQLTSSTEEPVSKCNSSSSSGTCSATLQRMLQSQHQQSQPDSDELQPPFQYHSRHDIEKLPSPCNSASAVLPSSNLFVKNPSVSKACKNSKYKVNTKTSAGVSPHSDSKKMVAAQDIGDGTNIDFDFDPSEELQYGPGIVSKLRCRYLSLALRQSAGKQRPQLDSLRRATSLNNLLDDDDESNSSCVVDNGDNPSRRVWSNNISSHNATARSPDEFVATFQKNLKLSDRDKRSRQIKRGNDSLKRARSVEALLGCDKAWDCDNTTNGVLPIKQIFKKIGFHNEPLAGNNIQELEMSSTNSVGEITIEDKISNARERMQLSDKPPKRLTSIIDDTERPPQDLVKQTLKIFEATANRRGRGLSRHNFNGEVAAKVATYKSIISQEKPPIVFPKPPLSPKKHFRKPGNLDIKKTGQQTASNKKTHPTSPVTNIAKKFSGCDLSSSTESSEYHSPSHSQSSSPTTTGHRGEITFRNSTKADFIASPGNFPRTPDIIPRKYHEPANSDLTSPITQFSKKFDRLSAISPQLNVVTPLQQNDLLKKNSESDDSIDGSDDSLNKRISKLALENISKAGTTQHFSFSKVANKSQLNNTTINGNSSSCDSGDQQQPTVKQENMIRALVIEPKTQTENPKLSDADISIDEISAKDRDNLVITNLTNTSSNRTSPPPPSDKPALTTREMEKNLINEKKNEQASLESAAMKWQLGKKKSYSSIVPSQNNCMVFNFKDRKEVPDYIENDGLIFKRKRELPKPNESGFVLLGDLSLETSTDPDDSWTTGPPSPCDVEFENANIIIDGKSSIRYRTKDISLRVQFDDTLTSTFEYPSESSLLEDSISTESSKSIEITDHISTLEAIQIPSPKLIGNVSLGSAPLSNYIPVKATIDTNFELGVTRAPTTSSEGKSGQIANSEESKLNSVEKVDSVHNGNGIQTEGIEYLKPASDDLTVVYSEGTEEADLLY